MADRWTLPAATRAAGESQHVRYDAAPAWDPDRCAARGLTPGAKRLARDLQRFAAIRRIGGYNCRANTASPELMSVHGTGRALDLMIEPGQDARGDAIANWLVEHASMLGVQLVIWRRTKWNGSTGGGRKDAPYTGPNPHVDHIHVELNEAGAGSGGAGVWVLLLGGAAGVLGARWYRRRQRR